MSTPNGVTDNGHSDAEVTIKVYKRSHRKLITFLLSCCVFLGVFSACLLAALVLIGKHYIHNHDPSFFKNQTTKTGNESNKPHPVETNFRLPRDVRPIAYDVTLKPNLENGTLRGKVNITLTLKTERGNVILNSDSLNVTEVVFTPFSEWDKQLSITNYTIDNELQRLVVNFNNTMSQGKYFLVVTYHGNTKNKTKGVYLSHYKDKDKKQRAMATSKFEPTYARQAFPCFDEPQMKAVYTVHLLKPDDVKYIALSNMPESSQETVNGGILVHFEPSEKMSTYLACFIVSDFISKDATIEMSGGNTIPLRVFATPEQIDKTDYAVDVGKKVIEYFNKYFDIDYPLPKLDMAAIPDFVSGAMEHWGLVTYRETALLYDPKISSTANKQRVATVIAHELAHSWFGNLVTMKWWNDLWLNEGFASYIEYKGVEAAEDDWKMMDQFLIEDLHNVLKIDAALSSHPIVQTVLTPDEITSIFDTISYSKGASILRMLENSVTEDVFKQGVTNYLRNNEYGNAVTDDLWKELENLFTDVKIKDFMDTWTVQMGYPVLNVKSEGNNYVLTQKRYLTDQSAVDTTDTPYNYKWIIPITYVTDSDGTGKVHWFFNDEAQITIPKPENAKWLKFNHNQVGYYRVNYEESHWNELIANIGSIESADKTHLIEETFRLASSGHVTYEIPLELSRYMVDEREYVPWSAFNTVMAEVMRFLQNSEMYTALREYVSDLVQPSYEAYTFDEQPGEGHLDKLARATVLNLGCSAGVQECNDRAADLFKKWLDGDGEEISQDLRQMVYIYGMRNSPDEYWDKLFDKFVAETDAGEKLRLLYGLASINDTSYLTKLIELASKDETYVRSQDYFTCLTYISYNRFGTSIVWDYVREHWPDLVERFTLNDRNLGNMIPSITQSFTTEDRLEEMEAFFAKYPDAGAGVTARSRALETVKNNIKWLDQYKDTVEQWIQKQRKV